MDNITAIEFPTAAKLNANTTTASNTMDTKPAGMSFSDWKKMKGKAVNARSTTPSVPSLSLPEGGAAAIVKVPPPVRPTPPPPKPMQHHLRRPPPNNLRPPPINHFAQSNMHLPSMVPFDVGWQQPPFAQSPCNPFKVNNCQFAMQPMPRMGNNRPKQQSRPPHAQKTPQYSQKNKQQHTQKNKQQHSQKKQPSSAAPHKMPPSQLNLMMPPPPPPPPLPQQQQLPQNSQEPTAVAKAMPDPKKIHLTPWRPMPKMPPPIIATTPESKEEKQRLWRQYRQDMKPFKNHEFLNAKRTIQRLGKKNLEELDEKSLSRLLRAQEFVAAHKQRVADKATQCWVRAMEEEVAKGTAVDVQTEENTAAAAITATTSASTPAQIYVRKAAPNWKKATYEPQQNYANSSSFPPVQSAQTAATNFINNTSMTTSLTNTPSAPKPQSVYGGRFILGGQLLSGNTTVPYT